MRGFAALLVLMLAGCTPLPCTFDQTAECDARWRPYMESGFAAARARPYQPIQPLPPMQVQQRPPDVNVTIIQQPEQAPISPYSVTSPPPRSHCYAWGSVFPC
jgi:hypothetical protein